MIGSQCGLRMVVSAMVMARKCIVAINLINF